MINLDFGNDSIIISHSYFGLFAYDLRDEKITNSLYLKAIGFDVVQGSNACIVEVGKDCGQVYLHLPSTSNMYVF